MNCGVLQSPTADSLTDFLSLIGLGKAEEETPATVDLEQTIIANLQLANVPLFPSECAEETSGTTDRGTLVDPFCVPTECSPVPESSTTFKNREVGLSRQLTAITKEMQFYHPRCNPQTCRMTSGMCVDCTNCLDHCTCGDSKRLLPATQKRLQNQPEASKNDSKNVSTNTIKSASKKNQVSPRRTTTRTKKEIQPSKVTNTKHRGINIGKSKTHQPQYSPVSLQTSWSLLAESTDGNSHYIEINSNTSKAKTRTVSPSKNSTSNNKETRQNRGSSHRYNMGDECGECNNHNYNHRAVGSHRRSASTGSNGKSKQASFSLLNVQKMNSGGILPSFSSDTGGSGSSRSSRSSRSSFSSSSRSYLVDEPMAETENSWFWLRYQSKE